MSSLYWSDRSFLCVVSECHINMKLDRRRSAIQFIVLIVRHPKMFLKMLLIAEEFQFCVQQTSHFLQIFTKISLLITVSKRIPCMRSRWPIKFCDIPGQTINIFTNYFSSSINFGYHYNKNRLESKAEKENKPTTL